MKLLYMYLFKYACMFVTRLYLCMYKTLAESYAHKFTIVYLIAVYLYRYIDGCDDFSSI